MQEPAQEVAQVRPLMSDRTLRNPYHGGRDGQKSTLNNKNFYTNVRENHLGAAPPRPSGLPPPALRIARTKISG